MNLKKKFYPILLWLLGAMLIMVPPASATSFFEEDTFVLPDPSVNPFFPGTVTPVAFPEGDAWSYSLPLLAYFYNLEFGGGVGPGNPYYIDSTPGQIKDDVVVATGASGTPVNTNFTGMDNAYPTPSGVSGSSIFATLNTPDPGQVAPDFSPDSADHWDSTLGAMTTFLNAGSAGTNMVFFFNNNQENSGDALNQNLWAWGQVSIFDAANGLPTLYFDFTDSNALSPPPLTDTIFQPWDAALFAGLLDPSEYTSPGAPTSTFPFGPEAWPSFADFVLSGGAVYLDAAGNLVPPGTPGAMVFNHNLGANQAAYALWSPELDAGLAGWAAAGYDTMRLDLRFFGLNNGYEQVFIRAGGESQTIIPEPATLLLVGSGLIGVAGIGRRKLKKRS